MGAEWDMRVEPATVNGGPGFRTIAPDGRLVNVVGLDVVDGRIARVHSMLNPDKLGHLGPVSDIALRPGRRPSGA
jgi:RNA polymerase sigma-70 factor (ECF subfamily)